MSSKKARALRVLVVLSVAPVIGCATGEHPYLHKTEKPVAVEWGYSGDTGPNHWGDLSPDYGLAKTGKEQSPIDISGAVDKKLPDVVFDYRPAKINLIYNGHTIEEKEDLRSSASIASKDFVLQQFHFHAPSEHTIDGKHADMEMHLVHQAGDKEIAVVAVLIQSGAENAAFAPIWDNLPTAESREKKTSVSIDAAELLPEQHDSYRYMGSFTTPPCTEGVRWIVLRTPVELSADQIEKFRAVIHDNNRPVQPLNGREILASE